MVRYALVVGISDYQSPSHSLSKTATDAQIVAQVLEQSNLFQEITCLTGTVTGKQLGQALQQLLLQQASSNEALIYFTGHGMTATGYLQQQSGYLVTTDSTVEWQDHQVIEVRRGISLSDFNQLILESSLNSLIVLLDCCHSGYFLECHCLVERLTAFSASKDYYFITACGRSEETIARRREPHSVFTGALLKALSRDNADEMGLISGDRLFDCLSRELKKSGLEPLHLGWGQAITVVKYPVAPLAPTPLPTVRRENPYVGLAAFDITQADYFYGRERAVRDLLDRLTKGRFLVVYGPSGCGKSSLIKAGLLPELQRDRLLGSREWDLECCTPGQTPVPTLEEILIRQHQRHQPFALFVDQFEELFTLCHEETQQRQFIQCLSEEEVNNPNARILIAIRGDFLDRCTQFPEVVKLINSTDPPSTYLVTPLTLAELEEAIEQPAARHGVTYEPGLVSQITEDVVGQPGELPLLQYALTELWKQCIGEGTEQNLTQEGYRAIGRVQGALQRRANLLYESFSSIDQSFVQQLMMELVQLGEVQEVSRRRVGWEHLWELSDSLEQLERVVKQLADERLIVTNDKTVEVAHEALLTEWPLLKQLIEQNREAIRLRRHLESDCQEWQEKGRSEDYLLSAGRLAAIEEWLKRDAARLPGVETEYVRKSQEKRDREHQKERQRWMLAVGLLCVATFSSLFLVSLTQENQVEVLTRLAENQFETHQQLKALITSIQGLNALNLSILKSDRHTNSLRIIINKVQERNQWSAHPGGVFGIGTNSVDSRVNIVSSGSDGKVKLWSSQGRLINVLDSQNSPILNVKLSRNKKMLAYTGISGKVGLQDLVNGVKYGFPGHSDRAYGIAFSSDDKMLVSSGSDGTLRIWSTVTKNQVPLTILQAIKFLPAEAQKRPYKIYGVDFSPKDRNLIAYGGEGDHSIWIWDSKSAAKLPRRIGQHEGDVIQVQFTSDGMKLISCSNDGMVKVWPIESPFRHQAILQIRASQKGIFSIDIRKDKNNNLWLASGGEDQTIRIWNLGKAIQTYKLTSKTLQPDDATATLEGYNGSIYRVQFATLNRINTANQSTYEAIISASNDGKIHLWEWQVSEEVGAITINQMKTKACTLINDYLSLNPIIRLETEISCP